MTFIKFSLFLFHERLGTTGLKSRVIYYLSRLIICVSCIKVNT